MTQRSVVIGHLQLVCFTSILFLSNTVFGHAQLLMEGSTPPRYDTASLKNTAPCGNESSFTAVKTDRISIFTSGETINVEWKETVQHNGQYHVDFSTTGIDGPYSGLSSMPDVGSATSWNMNYTLPNVTCSDCILRMRQDMGNVDISGHYFSCANVILVSGADVVAPSNMTNVVTTVNGTDIDVSWINPADGDYQSTILVRSPTALAAAPLDRKDYQVADTIGNGVVVYKGNAEQFNDSGLAAMTSYAYTVFSYDNDYNYNSGAVTMATTDQATGGGGGGTPDTDSGGGGALSPWWLLPLVTLWCRRRKIN